MKDHQASAGLNRLISLNSIINYPSLAAYLRCVNISAKGEKHWPSRLVLVGSPCRFSCIL